MSSTLLALVQQALGELGLFPAPTTVAGATEQLHLQAWALINSVGLELSERANWSTLTAELDTVIAAPVSTTGNITNGSAIVTNIPSTANIAATTFVCTGTGIPVAARVLSVDSATQVTLTEPSTVTATGQALIFAKDTYPVPADFRKFLNNTQWDRTNRWQVIGPMSPWEDQYRRSGIVTTGPRRRYRQTGRGLSVLRFWPPPTAADAPSIISTEYQTRYWAQNSAGTPQEKMTMDTDTCVFPDSVTIAGLKFKLWAAKGMDASSYQMAYEVAFQSAIAADGIAAGDIRMGGAPIEFLLTPWQAPDTGYGV